MWSDVFKGYRKRPRARKGLIMKRISGTSSMVYLQAVRQRLY